MSIDNEAVSSGPGRRKRKRYVDYTHNPKRRRLDKMSTEMRGVLISCNNGSERRAVREAYDLCNEFYKEESAIEDTPQSNDLSLQLKTELDSLKSDGDIKQFQSVDSGAKNLVFIKFSIDLSPRVLTERIFNSFLESKITQTRFILKFIPISHICHADIVDIKKTISRVLKANSELFNGRPTKYTIGYKCRYNDVICRTSVLEMINLAVSEEKLNLIPSYSNPELVIIVQVITSKCCLGIVRNYERYAKYNINELSQKNHNTKDVESEDAPKTVEKDCVPEI